MKEFRVYNQVFRIEKTVYSVQGVNLPVPLTYKQIGFFLGSFGVMLLLNQFPPLSLFPYELVKFGIIPFFITWFFTKRTFDGKAPHKFLWRWLEYQFSPRDMARYKEIPQNKKEYFSYEETEISYRR